MFSVKKFRVLLTDSGMTLKEFSRRSGVSAVAIGQILNHNVKPKIGTIGKLAKGLGVSAAALISDD